MGLHKDFPASPYAVLPPDVRWYPDDQTLGDISAMHLLPQLVHKLRLETVETIIITHRRDSA